MLRRQDDPISPSTEPDLEGLRYAKPDAFRAFFEAWFPRVYAFAIRRAGPELSQAITERVLGDALAQIQAGAAPPALGPWLLTLVKRELAEVAASR